MIKFFRKIRYDLMEKNLAAREGTAEQAGKTGKPAWPAGRYFKYAIGEIVLVMIGILLALQINTWNENRKLNAIKDNNYLQLLEDLKSDKLFIGEVLEKFAVNDSLYKSFLKSYNTPNLTMNDVIKNLGSDKVNYSVTTLRFQNSTITSIENTGEIKLIPRDLRKKLTDLKRDLDYVVETNSKGNQYYFDRIELAGTLGTGTSLQSRIENQPFLKEELGIQKNLAQIIWSSEIALMYKSFTERTTVKQLENIRSDIEEVIELINNEQ